MKYRFCFLSRKTMSALALVGAVVILSGCFGGDKNWNGKDISGLMPELAFELATVNAEIRMGVQREQALRNLAERTGLEDIRGLVGLLVQTMRFGTGIADTLRVYSEEFRDKRTQKAEEQAAKMGTKLVFPLVLCMFPIFFIVAIGPAVIRIIDAFSKTPM